MKHRIAFEALMVGVLFIGGTLVSASFRMSERVSFGSVAEVVVPVVQAGEVDPESITPESISTEAIQQPINPGVPIHLTIPKARVDADVIPVGVTETNNLDVPPNYVQVGWYKSGPKPGEIGSAVLDGHVDNGAFINGVFKHLRDLNPGDEITVQGENGGKQVFIVTRTDVYPTKQFPSRSIFLNSGAPLLKIITCHGTFIPSEDTYDQRLVITAELRE